MVLLLYGIAPGVGHFCFNGNRYVVQEISSHCSGCCMIGYNNGETNIRISQTRGHKDKSHTNLLVMYNIDVHKALEEKGRTGCAKYLPLIKALEKAGFGELVKEGTITKLYLNGRVHKKGREYTAPDPAYGLKGGNTRYADIFPPCQWYTIEEGVLKTPSKELMKAAASFLEALPAK